MACVDFLGQLHNRTKRDYVARVVQYDKAACAEVAKKYGQDYWDGERQYGYGGYKYDGRWLPIAQAMAARYGLKPGDRILDVCCGKGFLLHEFTNAVPGVEIAGIDISTYAIANAKEEVKSSLQAGNAISLPYPDNSFDFVVSLGGLHNLPIMHLFDAVREIDRVGKGNKKYIMVEILAKRTGAREPALLAVDLQVIPRCEELGMDLPAMRLPGRLGLYLL